MDDLDEDRDGTVDCPWCGEPMHLDYDPSAGSRQLYVEDCWVCCRPCVVSVRFPSDGGDFPEVTVERES